jgi:hypothetical protein
MDTSASTTRTTDQHAPSRSAIPVGRLGEVLVTRTLPRTATHTAQEPTMRIPSLIRKAALTLTASAAIVLSLATGASATCPAPSTNTPAPQVTSYIVTDSETTSVDLDITYQDNLDYELDHPELCTVVHLRANDGYRYEWTECYDVPVNEAPRPTEYP